MPPKLRYAVRDQVELHMSSLDQLLPEDHLAREIWAYVEQLDLAELFGAIKTAEGEPGAATFDPRTLLCLWLYATVESVGSARRLARLLSAENGSLPYRWISGGAVINYHTLADFRTRHEAILDRLLTASVAVLAQEVRIDLENLTVAHDGMRVRASAGRDSLHRRETLQKHLQAAQEHVRRLKEQCAEGESAPSARQRSARQRAARERVERLEQALEIMQQVEAKQRVRTDREPREPKVSSTDPEAAMLRMANGGKDPAHNLQFTTEVNTRTITCVAVAPMSSDTGMLAPCMQQHRSLHGRLPARVLSDQGYFKYDDIATLESQHCEVIMPDLYPNARTAKASNSYITQWRQRMNTAQAQQLYQCRKTTVEWSNARIRQQGLYQLTVRGRTKARIIGLWHALTHNILRTLALRRIAEVIAT